MNLEPEILYINVEDIIPNRFQPRLTFDDQALNELALSIKEHGIIQPLVLRKLANDKYEIIAGERRYKASQIAGLNKVPSIIANMDDNTSAEVALVENLQRKNLSAIEEAKSYKKLLDRGYLTQEQLAKRMGVSQSSVANKVRLLNLTNEVQDALMNEKISERHARSLLQISEHDEQIDMLNKIINNRLTVRQLDNEIKKLNSNELEELYTENSFDYEDNLNNKEEINDTESKEKQEDIDQDLVNLIINSKKPLEEKYEIFDIPTAEETLYEEVETVNKEEKTNKEKIIEGDLESVKTSMNKLEKEIETAGFKIETEEYDFEDLYQIIIKIEK